MLWKTRSYDRLSKDVAAYSAFAVVRWLIPDAAMEFNVAPA